MPNSRPNFPGGRKTLIARYLDQVGTATVNELAQKFSVSKDTVRRDLEELQADGAVQRSHGGATSVRYFQATDAPVPSRVILNEDGKRRIGRRAASFIEDGATVLMNGGSTVLAVAPYLADLRGITVVTNNLLLPALLPEEALGGLYIVGGPVRLISQATIGPLAFPADLTGERSHRVAADIALIGVGGVSISGGFTTNDLHEARMLREFMSAAPQVLVLADHTKFGVRRFAEIAPLSDADALVTDREPPDDLMTELAGASVETIVEAEAALRP